jgi:hypothetical protein
MKMTNTNRGALVIALAAVAGACADPAGPSVRSILVNGASSAIIPHPNVPAPSHNGLPKSDPNDGSGWVRLCKVSNVAGTFNFDVAVNGPVDQVNDISITVSAAQVNTPVCHTGPLHNSDLSAGQVDFVNIVEANPGANWTTVIDIEQWFGTSINYHANALLDEWNVAPRTAKVYINDDMEKLATFRNTFASTGCTYTKGWYRNNGSSTVVAVDGRTATEARAIFAATPGKPNGVTWGASNNNLNLYQQLLAALLNGGASGPPSVQAAIQAAQAAESGTGLNIVVAAGTDVSGLIGKLSAFNEGTLPDWPHCGGD